MSGRRGPLHTRASFRFSDAFLGSWKAWTNSSCALPHASLSGSGPPLLVPQPIPISYTLTPEQEGKKNGTNIRHETTSIPLLQPQLREPPYDPPITLERRLVALCVDQEYAARTLRQGVQRHPLGGAGIYEEGGGGGVLGGAEEGVVFGGAG